MRVEFIKRLSEENKTALILAACNSNYDIVKFLIKNGANINAVDMSRYTALLYALQNGHTRVVEYLILKGADTRNSPEDRTPVKLASVFGFKKIEKMIQSKELLTEVDKYFYNGEVKEVLVKYEKVLTLEKELERDTGLSSILKSISNCYFKMNHYENGMRFYRGLIAIDGKLRRELSVTEDFNNIGKTFYVRKKYSTAVNYLMNAFIILEEMKHIKKNQKRKI